MSSKKLSILMIVLIVLLGLGIGGGAYEANNVLESHAHHLAVLKAKNKSLNDEKQELKQDKQAIAKYEPLNKIAKAVVPQDKNQAEAVREIVTLAHASGIKKLSTVTFPKSNLGTTAKPAGSLTQATPVKGIPGVYELPITIQQSSDNSVPYHNFITFLSKLEQNRRTAQVSSITIQPDTKNPGNISFTLIVNVFIKP
jgi:biopolymer transport protein ExbD